MIARRRALRLGVALLVLLGCVLALRMLLQPARVTGLVLSSLGNSLGLEITASGDSNYTLRGTPTLSVRDLIVRQLGAPSPLLRADRLLVSVPWSTVRSRGTQLDITRIELDAPVLEVDALKHWLASRPEGKSRLPTLSDGLHVTGGRVAGDGWSIDALSLALPRLAPGRPFLLRAAGTVRSTSVSVPFDLEAAATRPGNDAGVAVIGTIAPQDKDGRWAVSARLRAAGVLHAVDGSVGIPRLRASLGGRYDAGPARLPFAVAITAPLSYRDGAITLWHAGIGLRGNGVVPDVDAGGALRYRVVTGTSQPLTVELVGQLLHWPKGWPALPPPLGQSTSPLPFVLRYSGAADVSDPVAATLRRDATRLDASMRIDDVLAWTQQPAGGTPLPPLSGRLTSPRLEVAGATLQGVEVGIEEDAPTADIPAAAGPVRP